jgi:hypothetical protein
VVLRLNAGYVTIKALDVRLAIPTLPYELHGRVKHRSAKVRGGLEAETGPVPLRYQFIPIDDYSRFAMVIEIPVYCNVTKKLALYKSRYFTRDQLERHRTFSLSKQKLRTTQ